MIHLIIYIFAEIVLFFYLLYLFVKTFNGRPKAQMRAIFKFITVTVAFVIAYYSSFFITLIIPYSNPKDFAVWHNGKVNCEIFEYEDIFICYGQDYCDYFIEYKGRYKNLKTDELHTPHYRIVKDNNSVLLSAVAEYSSELNKTFVMINAYDEVFEKEKFIAFNDKNCDFFINQYNNNSLVYYFYLEGNVKSVDLIIVGKPVTMNFLTNVFSHLEPIQIIIE